MSFLEGIISSYLASQFIAAGLWGLIAILFVLYVVISNRFKHFIVIHKKIVSIIIPIITTLFILLESNVISQIVIFILQIPILMYLFYSLPECVTESSKPESESIFTSLINNLNQKIYSKSEETKIYYETLCVLLSSLQDIDTIFNESFWRGNHANNNFEPAILPNGNEGTTLELILNNKIVDILNKTPFPYTSCSPKIHQKANIVSDVGVYSELKSDFRWFIDPLDGTRLIKRRFTLFSVCVALCKKVSENVFSPLLSLIYIPTTKELFFAIKGEGAFLNNFDNKLTIENKPLDNSFIYVQYPNIDLLINKKNDKFNKECDIITDLFSKVHRTHGLRLASIGLAYLAKGTYDAYIDLGNNTLFIDIAAGMLIIQEANGEIRPLIISNDDKKCAKILDRIPLIAGSNKIINQFFANYTDLEL